MIITIDIGNSRIKWGWWQADEITARGSTVYSKDDLPASFDKLFSEHNLAVTTKPTRVFIACVAGDEIVGALQSRVQQHWRMDAELLKTEKQFENIINAYDEPAQHGVDRWAGIVAGHLSFPDASVCVINAGTAITFDLIKNNGQHLGGYILPSYTTMHAALQSDTANVEVALDMRFNDSGVPDNTSDAVNQGLHKFIQAGVREFCLSAKNTMGEPMKIILAGGFAKTILAYPDMPEMHHKPDLVMQGLYHIMKSRKH